MAPNSAAPFGFVSVSTLLGLVICELLAQLGNEALNTLPTFWLEIRQKVFQLSQFAAELVGLILGHATSSR
jgi:hypothetical protein